VLRNKYDRLCDVSIERADFLEDGHAQYDYIVGNPPYVAITRLSETEKARYRAVTAVIHPQFGTAPAC
jgi:methylase of polypeptide subunit release factors